LKKDVFLVELNKEAKVDNNILYFLKK